jgi:hypothetical protein
MSNWNNILIYNHPGNPSWAIYISSRIIASIRQHTQCQRLSEHFCDFLVNEVIILNPRKQYSIFQENYSRI